ncbi:hypothetical protein DYB31_015383 [Aphanomyces astaci]|uniref:CCHC-type domain-containing protein n=1 Tax=Aphanomyces astaci TaxID=112090 RepID=A0A397F773_APHAT|nr:hypothetical protein DYB31_015383 [Aphanomyces astaci]
MPKALEGDYIELDNYDDEKTDLFRHQKRQQAPREERKRAKAAKPYRPDGTPDSSYDDESEDERRKANAERCRRNREAKPKNKKVDYVAQAKTEHARRLTAAFDSPKRKRDRYEEKLKANAQRMRHDWHATAVPWLESADRSMVEAACLYLWDISIDVLDESEFRERICKIIGEPANKWTVTKAEMEEQYKKLRVDPFGDVASRLKAPNMLKTFIKVVASCITPFNVRDRVEEQMKTVQASTLVEISKILAEQLERTYQAELVMKSRGVERKRGPHWDEKGQRTGKTRVQLKNEQYQREAYARKAVIPSRPRWNVDVTDLLVLRERLEGRRRTSMGPRATTRRPFEDSKQPAKRAKYGPGQDYRGALCFVCQLLGHRARECPNKKEDSA